MKNCFIRGSVVRYVQIPADAVDTQLLEDATRRGLRLCHQKFPEAPDYDRRCRGPQSDQTMKQLRAPRIAQQRFRSYRFVRASDSNNVLKGETRGCYNNYSQLSRLGKLYTRENARLYPRDN